MPQVLSALNALIESRRLPERFAAPLRPFIFGSQAGLHRYSQSSEKTLISLGAYDPLEDADYDYPEKAEDSVIDLSYVKLWVDDARLKYFDRSTGSGGTVAPVAGFANRVRSSTHTFKSSTNALGTSYPRTAASFFDRDVKVGDVAFVRGTVASVTYELWTSVSGFVAEQLAASISAATADEDNADTQGASTSNSQVDNDFVNDVSITSVNGSVYDGTPDGNVSETYTVTVTKSSVDGDATTAEFRVKSASGNDDQALVVPGAFGAPTDIGTRGLTVTWDVVDQPGVSAIGYSDLDFLAGQQWLITVNQAFTAPTATSGGTPTAGMPTTTYIITISRGGKYISATPPQITVSTTTGTDISGPTNVTAAATPVTVGSYGVTVQFNQSALNQGDIYYIPVSGVQNGALRTLIFNNSLPAGLLTATDLDLQLYITKNGLAITEERTPSPPDVNWVATADEFTTKSEITLYESSWTDDGEPLPLPLSSGTLYLEYREWLISQAGQVIDIYDITTVASILGTVDPDNPIAYGVSKALQNTAFTNLAGQNRTTDVVRCTILNGDPDDENQQPWKDALDLVFGMEDIYNLVPLTYSQDVKDLVVTHVNNQSSSEVGFYRACILALQATTAQSIRALDDDSQVILATIGEDPENAGEFTKMVNAASTADWITSGVIPGDIVRFQYTSDGFGNTTWSEYVVASVDSEDTIMLETNDLTAAVNEPQKVEIWRNLTKSEIVTDLVDQAEGYASSRVLAVWPDTINSAGVALPGYYLCSALAGLIGSLIPHQGITNVEVLGFDAVPRTTSFFTSGQLDTLANGGVFVVTQLTGGAVYVRKSWTTDPSSITNREEMVRRDLDAVGYRLQDTWSQYIGNSNIGQGTIQSMTGDFQSTIGDIRAASFTNKLDSMVTTGNLTDIRPHAVLQDKMVVSAIIVGPFPLNQVQLTLVV